MKPMEVVAAVAQRLSGPESEVWQRIFENALKEALPKRELLGNVSILDVAWAEGISPDNIVNELLARFCSIDSRIISAFERQRDNASLIPLEFCGRLGNAMVRFDPATFGVDYESYSPSSFGFDAKVDYRKVVRAAQHHGLRQPNLITALYFRRRFWDAHRNVEGMRYYVACEPIVCDEKKPPIIPVLDFDRDKGWFLGAAEVDASALLDVSVVSGQGEHYESTFVFVLPQAP